MDLFPFLIRRCGANIDKWIHNLHTSIRDTELRNDFMLAMQAYVPEADIRVEFPGADKFLGDHGDAIPPFAAVWGDFVEMITDRTVQGLDAQDVPSSIQKYAELFLLADVLRRSRDRKERAEKLKRRLRKVCQYVSSVSHLIQRAKRFFPIPHRWVTDTFAGTGECGFDLCDSAYDAVSRGLDQSPLSPEVVENSTSTFLPSSVTGKNIKLCAHASTPNFVSFWPTAPGPCCPPHRG